MTTDKPNAIIWFERLFFASLATLAADMFFHRDIFFGDIDEGLESGTEVFVAVLVVGIFVFGVQLLIWYFITYRASRIARSIYALFWVLGVIAIVAMFAEYTISELIFSLVTQSLTLASIVFLYRPDADIWFLTKGNRTGDEEEDLSNIFE